MKKFGQQSWEENVQFYLDHLEKRITEALKECDVSPAGLTSTRHLIRNYGKYVFATAIADDIPSEILRDLALQVHDQSHNVKETHHIIRRQLRGLDQGDPVIIGIHDRWIPKADEEEFNAITLGYVMNEIASTRALVTQETPTKPTHPQRPIEHNGRLKEKAPAEKVVLQ